MDQNNNNYRADGRQSAEAARVRARARAASEKPRPVRLSVAIHTHTPVYIIYKMYIIGFHAITLVPRTRKINNINNHDFGRRPVLKTTLLRLPHLAAACKNVFNKPYGNYRRRRRPSRTE